MEIILLNYEKFHLLLSEGLYGISRLTFYEWQGIDGKPGYCRKHTSIEEEINLLRTSSTYYDDRTQYRIAAKKALILTLYLLKTLGESFPEHCDSINPLPKALMDKLSIVSQRQLEKISRHMARYSIPAELAEITLYPVNLF